jgi:hypothetical protein
MWISDLLIRMEYFIMLVQRTMVYPDGVFHYFTVSDGSIDETIEIEERGNYTLAIRNNSGKVIRVSGFVKY